MRKLLTKTGAALALGGIALGAAVPADARHYYGGYGGYGGWRGGYHHYHGGRTAAVLGAGILGLAAGAAIASSPRYYYDSGPVYYDYDYGPSYYAPPPPPVYYDYGPYCRTSWRWDGWAHRYIRVRYCD